MHERWMKLAFEEALKAKREGEVPVGAVVVHNSQLIGRGHNLVETTSDPTAHAEIVALKDAISRRKSWRMNGSTLYVTLEPCPMCMGALHLARLNKLVFGAHDPRFGACGSYINLQNMQSMTTPFEVISGILADASSALLKEFFGDLRKRSDELGP
ncbi:MAG: nucleoside deaminase [Calditrichaeota bacterium]|nr:MAG: nucleoside deaminase [Calditrichota bacterium]